MGRNTGNRNQGGNVSHVDGTASRWSPSELIERNRRYLPGGVSSVNRLTDPLIAFARAEGAYLWDISGKRYVDYHAAFAPYFLGHNFGPVNTAAARALQSGESLFGSGPSILEGDLAELLCERIMAIDKIALLNTGSEATALAIRLSRAVTERAHIIVMQGGYNGNHDEVACNVFNTIAEIGPRVHPGEYPIRPLGAGTNIVAAGLVHPVNFNDLESVRHVCEKYPVAALITEPVLQNIGVIHPNAGYLQGLRELADNFGFLLIMDEVKTGFRHAVGGYCELANVRPDLVVYGKAIANGFPLAVVGGVREHVLKKQHFAERGRHLGDENRVGRVDERLVGIRQERVHRMPHLVRERAHRKQIVVVTHQDERLRPRYAG